MMKIAFVNQPIDTIIPPNQNSVGACTYWVARPLAQSAEVLVYGLTDNHGNPASESRESGIDFRFFPATRKDKWRFSLLKKLAKLPGKPHFESFFVMSEGKCETGYVLGNRN